jgi:hypothetical protein
VFMTKQFIGIINYDSSGLMFIPCIIRHSRNNQHYELIFTTPLFYILAPTCFESSLPPSGSFLDPSELLEIQIEWVHMHSTEKHNRQNHNTDHVTTHYDIPPIQFVFQVTWKDLRSSLMMADYCRNM